MYCAKQIKQTSQNTKSFFAFANLRLSFPLRATGKGNFKSRTSIFTGALKNKLLHLTTFSCLQFHAFSQSFGGFPSSFKWQMIDTNQVRVIFPKGLERQAQRVANTVGYLDANNRKSIGDTKHKINITLQNQTVISNGYVALAPFRSEFYTNPLQESASLGSIPWLDLLAIHEYRHVMQFANGRRGASLAAFIFSGQYGWAFANGLSVPNWFWEGDAVVTETALSEQGRGRLPSFFNPFRSLGLTSTKYTYMKVRNGSLKDYVPNHYNLGYLMCVYGRETYGNEFWKGVFADATAYKYVFYPFSRAIFNRTRRIDNSKRFYNNTLNFFQQKWNQELDTLWQTKAKSVNTKPKRNTVTNYEFPYFINSDEIVTLKTSYKQIPYFTKIDKDGNETKLKPQGYSTDNYFDYKNGKIVWSELRYNARWGNFDYSVLKIFDLKTEKTATLSTKSKYFSPALSQDATLIVAVEQTANQVYTLKICDAATGNTFTELPNPENLFHTYPKFSSDNQSIISGVRNKNGEMALISQQIATGAIEILVPYSNNTIGISFPAQDYIYFEASYSGIDNIYAVKSGDQQIYQITSRSIGNYQPSLSADGKKLVFCQFSKMGNKLYSLNIDSIGFRPFSIVNLSNQTKFDFGAMKEEGGAILNKVPNNSFAVQKYPQFKNFFNFHSWLITAAQPNYGIQFISDNILNNFSTSAQVLYNTNEKAFSYNATAAYGGLFPILQLGAYRNDDRTLKQADGSQYTLNETGGFFAAIVPLNFSKGLYVTRLSISNQYAVANNSYQFRGNPNRYNQINQNIVSELTYINARRKALQNIYAGFGQYLSANFKQSLPYKAVKQVNVDYEFSFQGIHQNHNLVLEGGFIFNRSDNNYRFTNNFYYPKGYNPLYLGNGEFYRLGINYHFPIAYPDWGFAGLLYFLRVRGNLFYDVAGLADTRQYFNSSSNTTENIKTATTLNSFGAELIFDISIFNALKTAIGLRYSILENANYSQIKGQNQVFEIFIPIKRL